LQGTHYDASVDNSIDFRIRSALCNANRDDPATYLILFVWSVSHVTPGDFPDVFTLRATWSRSARWSGSGRHSHRQPSRKRKPGGEMNKRKFALIITVFALLTIAAADPAAASSTGVLVRHDDSYIIAGSATLLSANGQVDATIHGTISELTTGFNSCPFHGMLGGDFGEPDLFFPASGPAPQCNLLGGEVTLNVQGTQYDAVVTTAFLLTGQIDSYLCKNPSDPNRYELNLFMRSTSHSLPGEFGYVFLLRATVQQISPTVWKWSSQ
jgi:hypothetical protein